MIIPTHVRPDEELVRPQPAHVIDVERGRHIRLEGQPGAQRGETFLLARDEVPRELAFLLRRLAANGELKAALNELFQVAADVRRRSLEFTGCVIGPPPHVGGYESRFLLHSLRQRRRLLLHEFVVSG